MKNLLEIKVRVDISIVITFLPSYTEEREDRKDDGALGGGVIGLLLDRDV